MSAATENSEITNQLKITAIIYFALILGLVAFFIIAIVIKQGTLLESNNELDNLFIFIIPIFGLMMMFTSRMIYNQLTTKIKTETNLLHKIIQYRTFKLISWAIIEVACILTLVATLLTSNYIYIVVFIFLLGYFILLRPSKESLVRDLRLNSYESDIIFKS